MLSHGYLEERFQTRHGTVEVQLRLGEPHSLK